MKIEIGAYITIITAIVAAFITYRNQLKLKAFELFLTRRDSVLKDIEKFIEKLYTVQDELEFGIEGTVLRRYKKEFSHEGLILYHKIKGANFGEMISLLLETFRIIIDEPIKKDHKGSIGKNSSIDLKDWISRTINTITALYAFAHSQITKEIESMAFSFIERIRRKYSSRIRYEKSKDK